MATRRKLSKWDVPARPGEFDWILKDIKDEVARVAPPPPPQEPPQRPPGRVVVNIEIGQATRKVERSWKLWRLAVLLWAIVAGVVILAQVSRAQQTWSSHREGFVTRYQGSEGWTGLSYQQGFTTHLELHRPDGSTRRCRTWQQGWQTLTECDK